MVGERGELGGVAAEALHLVEAERGMLRSLPADDSDCGIDLMPTVARNSRITVQQGYYSVPAKFIGSKGAGEAAGRHVVARHPRLTRRYADHDILDHYLEILLVQPGAFAGASALAQARAEGVFTKVHEAFWAAAKEKAGERDGTRMLIEVLLLHRQLPARALVKAMTSHPATRVGLTAPPFPLPRQLELLDSPADRRPKRERRSQSVPLR
ncbi:hypothetical protein [Streptomyces sp. NPDC019539]|uniref:hypothetical protein n=1 Tax=Streptomyces sp. NPDC019539 TaxID=3365063 RepID=UPI0037ACF106